MRFNATTHEPAWQKALPAGHSSSLGQPSTAWGARWHERPNALLGGLPEQGGQVKMRCEDALQARGSSSANHLQRKGPRSCSATAQPPWGRALEPPAQDGDVRGHHAGSGHCAPWGYAGTAALIAPHNHTRRGGLAAGCQHLQSQDAILMMQLLPNTPPLPPAERLKAEASSRRVDSGRRGTGRPELVAQPQPLLRLLLQRCSRQKEAK